MKFVSSILLSSLLHLDYSSSSRRKVQTRCCHASGRECLARRRRERTMMRRLWREEEKPERVWRQEERPGRGVCLVAAKYLAPGDLILVVSMNRG